MPQNSSTFLLIPKILALPRWAKLALAAQDRIQKRLQCPLSSTGSLYRTVLISLRGLGTVYCGLPPVQLCKKGSLVDIITSSVHLWVHMSCRFKASGRAEAHALFPSMLHRLEAIYSLTSWGRRRTIKLWHSAIEMLGHCKQSLCKPNRSRLKFVRKWACRHN